MRCISIALCFAGCAQAVSPVPVTTAERSVMGIVRQALENDAAGLVSDSLYLANATIVSNGAEYTSGERFAGVRSGGFIRISNMSGDVDRRFAWAYVTYRWMSPDGAMTQSARASFILQEVNGIWRIKHVHSSLVLPWQRSGFGTSERSTFSFQLSTRTSEHSAARKSLNADRCVEG